MPRSSVFLVALLFSLPALVAAQLSVVVGVVDGDTIDVRSQAGGPQTRCRLAGIDAPEKSQAFGQVAKQRLSDSVYKKTVLVDVVGQDTRYGRLICRIWLADRDINLLMVREGLAWVYRQYTKDPALYAAERDARLERRGLWQLDGPVPPWEFRREHR